MRITVDLDDDLLTAVEERCTASKTTGQVLADLARQALASSPAPISATRSTVRRDDEDRVPTLTPA